MNVVVWRRNNKEDCELYGYPGKWHRGQGKSLSQGSEEGRASHVWETPERPEWAEYAKQGENCAEWGWKAPRDQPRQGLKAIMSF